MKVDPYLYLGGRCDEAIEFYKRALGAEVTMLMRYKDCPDDQARSQIRSGMENRVMHASLRIGDSIVNMSDGRCEGGGPEFAGFALTLRVLNDAQAEKAFAALGDGGKVTMPPAKTFFSSRFGMLSDRFGVSWMVIVQP